METTTFKKLATNGFLLNIFLLVTLPMAFMAGIKVKHIDDVGASTTVKYGWMTKNPFKSMYFAVLAMAAEMSTGILLIIGTRNSKPEISMLVVKNSAEYFKKAIGTITFTCLDAGLISDSIKKAKETGEGLLVVTKTTGRDQAGDVVAEFEFIWSIKAKTKS